MHIKGRRVHLSLIDSVALNNALKKLWRIDDVVISPTRQTGVWFFSLHVGLFKSEQGAQAFIEGDDIIDQHERSDTNLLWLKIEGDLCSSHHFYQHETDGYYHMYTGLYLSKQNVINAQRLLLEHSNLKTTIVSQYITTAIIKKYAYQ